MEENEETPITTEQKVAANRARRDRMRGKEGATEGEPVAVSQAKMLNEPMPFDLPAGLTLTLKAPSIKRMRLLTDLIEKGWTSDVQVIALTTPLPDGSYDLDAVTAMVKSVRGEQSTVQDALAVISGIGFAFNDSSEIYLSAMADCLLLMADGTPPEKQAVVDALEDATVPQLIDLLRRIWAACGGFQGDVRSRFWRGS